MISESMLGMKGWDDFGAKLQYPFILEDRREGH